MVELECLSVGEDCKGTGYEMRGGEMRGFRM